MPESKLSFNMHQITLFGFVKRLAGINASFSVLPHTDSGREHEVRVQVPRGLGILYH